MTHLSMNFININKIDNQRRSSADDRRKQNKSIQNQSIFDENGDQTPNNSLKVPPISNRSHAASVQPYSNLNKHHQNQDHIDESETMSYLKSTYKGYTNKSLDMLSEREMQKVQYSPRMTPNLENDNDQAKPITMDQENPNTSNPLRLNATKNKSKLTNELYKIEEQYDKFDIKFQFSQNTAFLTPEEEYERISVGKL